MYAKAHQSRRDPTEGMDKREDPTPLVIGGVTLTGPLTITVVKTVVKTESSTSSLATTSLSSTSSTTSSSSTTQSTPISTSSPKKTSSVSSPSAVISIIPPTQTPKSADIPSPVANGALARSSGLSAGGVAGIIVGIFLLFAIPLFIFLLRRRLQKNRRSSLQRRWSFSPGVTMNAAGPAGVSPPAVMGSSVIAEKAGFSDDPYGGIESNPRQLTVQIENPISRSIPQPASTYNNESTYTSPSTPYSAGVYSPSTNGRSPYSATVNFTFLPTRDDELSIRFGDTLRVLAEYDDGWALCSKPNGEQGMVPLECLSDSTGASGGLLGVSASPGEGNSSLTVPSLMGERRGSMRASSLGPQAQASKDYRT
ncbi:hypothetical protein CPB83DRAFT_846548 [Crepidotus variabilis]|uniref:SH3 domain-containing protein n=1 Tax=Crepidotus variabilis TaxID=179855 RepID=A0A9P6EQ73_9AGAR|nr:hypothetical protein CPB83DRAFT_846548 [Crepidotus variabilis]